MSLWLVFILGASLAGFVQGLTGFAFALIAMSCWVWILPPQLSAPLVVFASLWCHLISLSKEQKYHFGYHLVLPYLVAGLIGVPLGTCLLKVVNADIFKLILGVFLMLWCPVMYFAANFSVKFSVLESAGKKADAWVGFMGGILGGLGGFCGALPSAWVMLKNLPKDQQRYILRHFNFAVQLFTLLVYLWQGTIDQSHLSYMGVLILTVSLPAMWGAQLFYTLSERKFKQIVLSLLFASGCILSLTSISRCIS